MEISGIKIIYLRGKNSDFSETVVKRILEERGYDPKEIRGVRNFVYEGDTAYWEEKPDLVVFVLDEIERSVIENGYFVTLGNKG